MKVIRLNVLPPERPKPRPKPDPPAPGCRRRDYTGSRWVQCCAPEIGDGFCVDHIPEDREIAALREIVRALTLGRRPAADPLTDAVMWRTLGPDHRSAPMPEEPQQRGPNRFSADRTD